MILYTHAHCRYILDLSSHVIMSFYVLLLVVHMRGLFPVRDQVCLIALSLRRFRL